MNRERLESIFRENFKSEPLVRLRKLLESPYKAAFRIMKEHTDAKITPKGPFIDIDLLPGYLLHSGDHLIAGGCSGREVDPPWFGEFREELQAVGHCKYLSIHTATGGISAHVPLADSPKCIDALLYLAITGQLEGDIPLSVALLVSSKDFAWQIALDDLSKASVTIVETPGQGMLMPGLKLTDDHRLVIEGEDGETHLIGQGWRERKTGVFGLNEPVWAPRPDVAPFVKCGDQLICLVLDAPEDMLKCNGILRIQDLMADLTECLRAFQSVGGDFNDAATRRSSWSGDKVEDEIVARLAEGILSVYAPWPDPFTYRKPEHESWQWSHTKCSREIKPLFQKFISAPLRSTTPNLVAKFLTLIQDSRMGLLAMPTEYEEGWKFQLRAKGDHTWINGTIWVDPRVDDRDRGLKIMIADDGDDSSSRAIISAGNCFCRMEERGDR